MVEVSFSILFYVKKPKGYEKGDMPVYMRITVNGVPKEITTKQYCHPDRWNPQAQRARGTNEESKTVNCTLDALERQVHEARIKLMDAGTVITADALKQALTGKGEKVYNLVAIFEEHNKQVKALVGIDYAPATLTKYTTTLEHLRAFIAHSYDGATDIDIQRLSYDFINAFSFWVKTVKKCNHNSTIKHISNLRKIVNHCLKSGWLQKDPFLGFTMSKKPGVREFLTDAELEALTRKDFAIERLSVIRDIFLFSCYTGLAFIDVFQLTPQDIATGIDGKQWIFTARQKTATPSRIPLLPPAKVILEKYKEHPKCINENKVLPVISNQKMNAYLKEIADLCSIRKTLTFHIARHTFATTVTLSNGVPIETVSKMLGHSSIKMTQHYAKILDKKVSEDMLLLENRLLNI